MEARGLRVGTGWIATRAIGRGGSAVVYEAVAESGERAALKVLHERWAGADEWLRRFRREARIIQSLDHPGIARYLEAGVLPDGRPFLVTELLVGRPLSAVLADSRLPFPLESALRLADELLAALEAAHSRGVVHRDVTPANIFVTANERIKLIDFGVASSFHGDGHEISAPATRGVLGTPAFMPPEQARGRFELVDARTDVWAVGAVLFTLLTRQHVHVAATENEQLGLAMSHPARSLASVRADLDADVVAVIDRALAYDKDRRWRTAGEFRAALRSPPRRADASSGEVTRRSEDVQPVLPVPRTRRDASKTTLGFVGMTAGVGLVLLLAPPTRAPSGVGSVPPALANASGSLDERDGVASLASAELKAPPALPAVASATATIPPRVEHPPSSGPNPVTPFGPVSTSKAAARMAPGASPDSASPSVWSEPRAETPTSAVPSDDLMDGRTPPPAGEAPDLFEQRF